MEYKFTPKFKLDQIVYLKVPDSDAHTIIDIAFSVSPKEITYGLLNINGDVIYLPKYAISLHKILT